MGAEPVALIGRNGMGKSTLCRPSRACSATANGSVRLDGRELLGKPAYKVAGAGIGYVPQGRRLFESLTVDEHLEIVGRPLEGRVDGRRASTSSSRGSPSAGR